MVVKRSKEFIGDPNSQIAANGILHPGNALIGKCIIGVACAVAGCVQDEDGGDAAGAVKIHLSADICGTNQQHCAGRD